MCWPPMLTEVLTAPGVALTVPCADTAAQERTVKENASRDAFGRGELGLNRYGLRAVLSGLGVEYVDYQAYLEAAQ